MRWDDAPWKPWSPAQAAQRLAPLEAPWYVAAGWAIDLFLGAERREHEDLEVAVPTTAFERARTLLPELEFHVPSDDEQLVPIDSDPSRFAEHHQTWGLDRDAYAWRIDIFREPSSAEKWVCRRDARIRLPYEQLIERTADGIPYARPEVVLLFKAKAAREKDEDDLDAVLPRLGATRRAQLREWLALVHPGHAWLERVSARR
jgi:hypothetical protein